MTGEWTVCETGYCLDDNHPLDLRRLDSTDEEDRAVDPDQLVGATVTVVVLKEDDAWLVLAIEQPDPSQ